MVCSAMTMPTAMRSVCQLSTFAMRSRRLLFVENSCDLVGFLEPCLDIDESSINQDSSLLLLVMGRRVFNASLEGFESILAATGR